MTGDRRVALLALPFAVGVVGTVLGPALWTVAMAFTDWDLIGPADWVGLGQFRRLIADDVFRISLGNSLSFVTVAVPLRLAAVLLLGLLLHRPGRGVGAHRTAVLTPTVIPDVAYAVAWLWIANPLYGPLNAVLGGVGFPTPAWFTDGADARWLVVIMSLFTVGEGVVVTIAARNQIPTEFYEAAALDDLGTWATFRTVTLPVLVPTLFLLAVRDAAFAFQATFVPALIVTDGGPPPFSTTYLPLFAYRTGFEYLRYGTAAAVTVVMLLVTALVIVVQKSVLDPWQRRS